MSRVDDSIYTDSSVETADSERGFVTGSVGTDLASAPPSEPMSRDEYAGYMHRGPAAGAGDDATGVDDSGYAGDPGDGDAGWSHHAGQTTGGRGEQYADPMREGPAHATADHGAGGDHHRAGSSEPVGTGYEPRGDDPAVQAQGMTRGEYADHMQQGPAAADNDTDATPPAAGENGSTAVAETGEQGIPPAESLSGRKVTDNGDHDAASAPHDQPARPALTTGEAGQTPEAHASADNSADSEVGQADDIEAAGADAGKPLSPEGERLQALEAENDQAKKKIADLEAKNDEQAARLDRVEQLLESIGGRREDEPEYGADNPDTRHQDSKSPSLAENKNPDGVIDAKEAEPTRWRRAISAENVGAAGALVGAADTVAQFAMHATPEGVVGLGATTLGLVALGLGKFEKNRKERHDRPDRHQG